VHFLGVVEIEVEVEVEVWRKQKILQNLFIYLDGKQKGKRPKQKKLQIIYIMCVHFIHIFLFC